MSYLFVGIGGAAGSLARYMLGRMIAAKAGTAYPAATFIINITGALLLGLLSSLEVGRNVYFLLGDGLLGAYTTFSTFMYEGFALYEGNKRLNAAVYISSSLILGIIGYISGVFLAGSLTSF